MHLAIEEMVGGRDGWSGGVAKTGPSQWRVGKLLPEALQVERCYQKRYSIIVVKSVTGWSCESMKG